jgi:hypothetical protein
MVLYSILLIGAFFTDCTDKIEPSPMAVFNDHNAAIHLKTLKQYGFYQIFFPNGENIFGWNIKNINRLSFIALTVIIQCLMVFGNCGFLFDLEDTIDKTDLFIIIFSNVFNFYILWKMIILIFYRNKILDLLNVTSLNFLKSEQCLYNIKILYKHRNRVIQSTQLYYKFCMSVLIPWFIYPIIINSFVANKNDNRRLENIINRRYPMDVNTYNQYYVLFYIIETIIAVKSLYLVLMIDILLLSIGWAIIVQYEVLAVTFKNIGHVVNLRKGETKFLCFENYFKEYVSMIKCRIINSIRVETRNKSETLNNLVIF